MNTGIGSATVVIAFSDIRDCSKVPHQTEVSEIILLDENNEYIYVSSVVQTGLSPNQDFPAKNLVDWNANTKWIGTGTKNSYGCYTSKFTLVHQTIVFYKLLLGF